MPRKRFKFAEKFRKLTKSSESHVPHAKFSTIFKFADKLDYLLMIIGSIAGSYTSPRLLHLIDVSLVCFAALGDASMRAMCFACGRERAV